MFVKIEKRRSVPVGRQMSEILSKGEPRHALHPFRRIWLDAYVQNDLRIVRGKRQRLVWFLYGTKDSPFGVTIWVKEENIFGYGYKEST